MAKTKSTKQETEGAVIHSSGNVFEDMGLPEPGERMAKAKLVHIIEGVIKRQKLNQTNAATLMGVSQPDLSKLLKGRTQGFSIDRLLTMLLALGMDVSILVRPKATAASDLSVKLAAS